MGHTYARMALAEILPSNVDRVLSLDSDTLVLDSIQEMYNTAFEKDQIVAGVYDCVGTAIQKSFTGVRFDEILQCGCIID